MTPKARATAHQRITVCRCGVALRVFPKNSKKIQARAGIPVNTEIRKYLCSAIKCKGSVQETNNTEVLKMTKNISSIIIFNYLDLEFLSDFL